MVVGYVPLPSARAHLNDADWPRTVQAGNFGRFGSFATVEHRSLFVCLTPYLLTEWCTATNRWSVLITVVGN
jgi:hypothetical protein